MGLSCGSAEKRSASRCLWEPLVLRDPKREWHFGILSITGTGHLNPFIALSLELKRRGHRVTFVGKPKIRDRVIDAGLEFLPIAAKKPAARKTPARVHSGFLPALSLLGANLGKVIRDVEAFLEETPAAIAEAGVNVLLVDELALTGPTVAQMLSLPYFIVSTSIPCHLGWSASTRLSGCRPLPGVVARLQRSWLELSVLRMRGPVRWALDRWRRQARLGPARKLPKVNPHLAHITQLPECLDLPQRKQPGNFHYAGPLVSADARPQVPFPWTRLDGRPLVYATLGTTRHVQPVLFPLIAEACSGLNLQLVISLGNRFDANLLNNLPGDPVVTRYAPQLELLKIARVVVTHGGSNTVLETLIEGKPLLVIPGAFDQFAMAARLERLHVARALPQKQIDAAGIRNALAALLDDPEYLAAAQQIQARMQGPSGTNRAADIIEQALHRDLDRARSVLGADQFRMNARPRQLRTQTASKLSRQ
jgi:zeaxanthin glucosyltransferase